MKDPDQRLSRRTFLQAAAAGAALSVQSPVMARAAFSEYKGRFVGQQILENGDVQSNSFELRRDQGRLQALNEAGTVYRRLAFDRKDYVLVLDPAGRALGIRADFVPGADGRTAWWRFGGRLHRHQRD